MIGAFNLRGAAAITAILVAGTLFAGCTTNEVLDTADVIYRSKQKEARDKKAKPAEKAVNEDGKAVFMEDQGERPKGKPVKIFQIGSDLAVQNGGTPPTFTMKKEHWVTELWTYHWNGGGGAPAGTIALKSSSGKTYGPWKPGIYNKVYWVAKPDTPIPAGTYTVIDSDPATLAQNSETGGQGMAWMHGIPTK